MQHAIPFFTRVPDGAHTVTRLNVGTAFFASHRGIDYLISAAHVPSGVQPTDEWSTWDRWMTLRTPEGDVSVELFVSAEDGELTPTFGYRAQDADPRLLQDMMWFPLVGGLTPLRDRLIRHFTHFSLTPADHGHGLMTAHGYPDDVVPWPQLKTTSGMIRGLDGLKYLLDMETTDGFSGSPVIDEEQSLVGMLIGSKLNGNATVVPTAVLRALVERV